MKRELFGGIFGTGLSALGTAIQTEDVLRYISLGITILGGLISMIIIPILNWYKMSKKDGKISKEEIEEGIKIISDGSQAIKESINKDK